MALLDISGDIWAHDPVIVKEAGRYWRFQTGPGLPFFVSDDLLSWKEAGRVFHENPSWTATLIPGSTHFWAPDLAFRGGVWRIWYSVSTFGSNLSAIGLAESRSLDPASPDYGWTDRGLVISSIKTDNFNAIDPGIFSGDDGQDWLLWGSFWDGLKLRRLDSLTGKPPFGDTTMYSLARRWVDEQPNPVEGGFIVKRGQWYYLFASHDFCCRGSDSTYHIVVGRSRAITGPYLDREGKDMAIGGGTLVRDGTFHPRWAGPGHNSIFHENGDWYLVYHAYDRTDEGHPKLQLEKLGWDEDWPVSERNGEGAAS